MLLIKVRATSLDHGPRSRVIAAIAKIGKHNKARSGGSPKAWLSAGATGLEANKLWVEGV
jgi:hypothetical protein